ncbi:hypothetical protein [Pseudonocardia sp.]|uniref:hypothetical protein n=1 Tax=Pseudonocardia sp. TaxID=60912 RepID=UPI002624C39A|nr:hypothetical protein [Pseudonocardia sp.]
MDVPPAAAPLRRPTAHARRALVAAQIGLACLVVLAAAAVGGAVQDRVDDRAGLRPAPVGTQQAVVRDESRPASRTAGLDDPPRGRGAAPGEIGRPATRGGNEGPLAALGTLLVGWTLTAAAGTVGRRRLEEWEHDRWAAEWAGVEPVWSGRVS